MVARVGHNRGHGYGYGQTEPGYTLTLVERGGDLLVACSRIGADRGQAMKADACRRASARQFFGHIAYASLLAHKHS